MNTGIANYGNIFVGRQPILGPNLKTIGYEVLYRDCESDSANIHDEAMATAQVLLNTYLDIGLEHVVGTHLAFLNIPEQFLLDRHCEALPKHRVVLEILETVEPTPEVIEAMTSLSQQGYTIALDDFVFHDRFRPFLELADIVKIDVLDKTFEQLQHETHQLRNYRARLLAEKVETREAFETCKHLGMFYFQGFFFYRPDIIRGHKIPANRVALLELLGKFQDPNISFEGLVECIRNDLSLSYKILRYVNSASVGLPRRVESIEQAACMVGLDRIRTWASLIVMASGENRPMEMLVIALVRAKMCESLGQQLGADSPEKYFTMGLLSVLEALYGSSMEKLVGNLPLPDDILEALILEKGTMGAALSSVKAYEKGEWLQLKTLQFTPGTIRDFYVQAIDWANHFSPMIDEAA
ncbi:EAL and HDOD domain-containing protein [Candidatus Nitrospira neomarina]|uniref:HDOD domain-containing protein n=1 Tax=Candidatus Nitrospira neomarina TaxID=3020899 RepID=A0AA96JXC8_9BACT|nr:HDOD domain-containing protein [Candidatus Nitrospira neomarina]WNM63867.1 HDOD domain-containing protein [Candidatus Nitrospira neomarina]